MTPITFAHRGGATGASENSVESFRSAVECGADGIHSDLYLSADAIPVLAYGPVLRRGVRRLRVSALTVDELSRHDVPRLDEVYDVVGPERHVSLDLKAAEAALPALEVARRFGGLERLWLCSPELDLLRGVRAQDERVRLVHSTIRRALTEGLERHAATLAAEKVDAFAMHRTEWSRGLVTLFRRFDVLAFARDVQEVRHLREILRYGVDGVYCDHVERMVAVIGEWAGGAG